MRSERPQSVTCRSGSTPGRKSRRSSGSRSRAAGRRELGCWPRVRSLARRREPRGAGAGRSGLADHELPLAAAQLAHLVLVDTHHVLARATRAPGGRTGLGGVDLIAALAAVDDVAAAAGRDEVTPGAAGDAVVARAAEQEVPPALVAQVVVPEPPSSLSGTPVTAQLVVAPPADDQFLRPASPSTGSLPLDPSTRSLPASPRTQSSPSPPDARSLPPPARIMSLSLQPVMSRCRRCRRRRSRDPNFALLRHGPGARLRR